MSDKKPERTKGPWYFHKELQEINDEEGNIIADLFLSSGTNGPFIVTACNHHDELVEFVRYIAEEPGPHFLMSRAQELLTKLEKDDGENHTPAQTDK